MLDHPAIIIFKAFREEIINIYKIPILIFEIIEKLDNGITNQAVILKTKVINGHIKNKKTFIIVGGDFNTPDSTYKNCVISTDGGNTWTHPLTPPNGYRSCVEYIDKKQWVSCGLNGVDISNDDGQTWKWISKESFNVCRKAKKGKSIFFAGGKGLIGKL